MNELKSFQVVYQERSMNQAAKKLYITSQGLGRIIQNLEKELGVQLFERSARGVEPTEAAELSAPACRSSDRRVRGDRESTAPAV